MTITLESTSKSALEAKIAELSEAALSVESERLDEELRQLSEGAALLIQLGKVIDVAKGSWIARLHERLNAGEWDDNQLRHNTDIFGQTWRVVHRAEYNYLRYDEDGLLGTYMAEKSANEARNKVLTKLISAHEAEILSKHPNMTETDESKDVWTFIGNTGDVNSNIVVES